MLIPEEVICRTCEKVFCCSECREKHELKTHAIVVKCVDPILHLFCPICAKKPLALHELMHTELLTHIIDKHLPLNCRKCSKLYTRIEDFHTFSKCIENVSCNLEVAQINTSQLTAEEITQQPPKSFASSVSTQTSPYRVEGINDSHLTPMINLRWKAKSKTTEEFISDSVSSIRNISSINNSSLRKSIGLAGPFTTKGKLVRSTSTPLQSEIFAKPKEHAFNDVSGGHMSSIHNSVSESESSPPLAPQMKPIETVSRYQKPRGRGRTATVTPLRQVMSKSIHKAMVEHGIASDNRAFGYQRKKIFESIDSSNEILEKSIENTPLDLRLSPAFRRTQSEIIDSQAQLDFLQTIGKSTPLSRQILLSSTKKTETTESIVITSSSTANPKENNNNSNNKSANSVYQTCRSVEIITSTSTELSEVKINENEIIYQKDDRMIIVQPPITPRIPSSGVITNKKVIKFETPIVVDKMEKRENNSPDELFFTPSSTPIRNSKTGKSRHFSNNDSSRCDSNSRKFYSIETLDKDKTELISDYTDFALDDDVFEEEKKPERGRSKLWDLVASVIRLPSLNVASGQNGDDKKPKNDTEFCDNSTSIIRRCASFAGSLVRQKAVDEDDHDRKAVKRKRTYTNDFNYTRGNNSTEVDFNNSDPKRFRIHGRRPIQRMRCNY